VTDETPGRNPANPGEGTADGLEALTEEVLPALIARLRASRLGELEVRTDGWRVRLRRDGSVAARTAAGGTAGSGDPEAEFGSVARSPAVGYFKPAPNLVVGRSVQASDLIGSIDVLGIVQEVTAPEAGIIAAVLAEDGQAVEYGQALADIDPLDIEEDGAKGAGR
jgi:CubicO group peptidase (beta-lactamase class C family)